MGFDKNVFDSNFSYAFNAMVTNNFLIATKAFEEFWKSNLDFLRDADDLYGRLLYYAINQQFKRAATKSASLYFVKNVQVTKFKNQVILLNTNDYITSICRTDKPSKLPSRAKYKLELAQGNQNDSIQMKLNFNDSEISFGDMKKYAIIGYRYINGAIGHLNIIVPDSGFRMILHSKDLLENVKEYKKYVPEELIYEQVTDLKSELIVKLKETKII